MSRGTVTALAKAASALAIVGLVVGLWAGAASAHAELVASDPADGAVVAEAPGSLTLQFTESVSVQADGVRVLDDQGSRVDGGTATASGNVVEVPLDDGLADGSYVVAWRVVSADGHAIRGALTFSIGARSELRDGLADEAFAGSADRRDEILGAALRMLAYGGALVAGGLVVVGGILRRPGEPSPVGRVAVVASTVGLVGVLGQVPLQASLATGLGWGAITKAGVFDLAVADGVGWSTLMLGVGLIAIAITGGLPFEGAARAVATAGACLVPFGFAITGHTRTMSPAVVGYAADVAHVAAAALWLGGLWALLSSVRRRRAAEDPFGAAEAVATFSGIAAVSVLVVGVAGLALGWITVGGIEPLSSTTYGRLLMAKVGVVGLVGVGAIWNRFRLVPAVAASVMPRLQADAADAAGDDAEVAADEGGTGDDAIETVIETGIEAGGDGDGPADGDGSADGDGARAWRNLRRVVGFELVGLILAVGVTGVLSNVTPAAEAAIGGDVSVSAPLGEGSVEVTVSPASPGRNDVHIYLFDAEGRPDGTYEEASLSLELPAQEIGPLEPEPVPVAPGHFQLVGTDLPLAGEWTITVTVQPDRFTQQEATLSFRIR